MTNVVFLTVHSGVGGEAETFRRAVEGRRIHSLGANRAAYSLKRIQNNLANLTGAQVTVSQGERVLQGLSLVGTARLGPAWLAQYYRLPAGEALELTASLDPAFTARIAPEQPMLIFETCGWKLPSEPGSQGVADTSGSVYLGVIQQSP